MSFLSYAGTAVIGAGLAAFVTWRVATGWDAATLATCHTQLAQSQANGQTLERTIDETNKRVTAEHTAYLQAAAEAKALQDIANQGARKANAKANTILIYKPGDDYALSSLDAIAESLK